MELRHLRYFLAVAEEGHFGRAAEKLHIVQSALSMQIRALEEELDALLFTRTSRRVELTEAGQLLVVEAQRTLAQADRAKEIVHKSASGEIGSVRVGFSGNAAFVGKLSSDLRLFHKQFPKVEIELQELSAQKQADAILAGVIDVGYCPTFDIAFHPDLHVERIGRWPWLLALNVDHPLARQDIIDKTALRDETFIVYAAHADDTAQRDILRHIIGQAPKVAYSIGNTLTGLTMTAAGLGLVLAPASLETVLLPGLTYRPLSNVTSAADLALIYRAHETSGAVRRFIKRARHTDSKTPDI